MDSFCFGRTVGVENNVLSSKWDFLREGALRGFSVNVLQSDNYNLEPFNYLPNITSTDDFLSHVKRIKAVSNPNPMDRWKKKHFNSYSFAFHSQSIVAITSDSKPKVPLYPHEDDNYEIIYIHFSSCENKNSSSSSFFARFFFCCWLFLLDLAGQFFFVLWFVSSYGFEVSFQEMWVTVEVRTKS